MSAITLIASMTRCGVIDQGGVEEGAGRRGKKHIWKAKEQQLILTAR
jgi:hypothetical protein